MKNVLFINSEELPYCRKPFAPRSGLTMLLRSTPTRAQ